MGLTHALALIKMEQLGIPYDEAVRLVKQEDNRIEAEAARAIVGLEGSIGMYRQPLKDLYQQKAEDLAWEKYDMSFYELPEDTQSKIYNMVVELVNESFLVEE